MPKTRALLELTFLLNQKSNKKVKAICQPEFFAMMLKYKTLLTKNSGSHQIAVCHRTLRDANQPLKFLVTFSADPMKEITID